MSALTDLFTAMANKIRSKTGTQTTYTPSEMVSDGIDDVFDAGVASVPTPTSITPSNSSPVALTADTPVNPTASGYAIENYNSITPSNSSPVSLAANTMVKPLTIGQAILGYTDLTPSNTNPVQLPLLPPPNQPPIYRLRASGFAIQDYSTATPSDTSPASVSSGAIIKASASGYLVKNTPVNIGVPDIVSQANMNGSASRSITVTKMPRYVIFLMTRNSDSTGRNYSWFYDVAKDAYSLIQYTADGYSHNESTGAPTTISVTSSSVTVTNTTAATCRTHVLIYY